MIKNIINNIIKTEGGYVNHPADRGGPTKYGITQKTYTEWLGRPATIDDIKQISIDVAEHIYKNDYYRKPKIYLLPAMVHPVLVDMSVNHGPVQAVKILQDELQRGGYPVGKIDGKIGSKTTHCTQLAIADHSYQFINYIVNRRIKFYEAIVQKDPTQAVFLKGWIKRANQFKHYGN